MFLLACWNILCELAPWLLLGMALSGIMHVLLPKNFIRKRLKGAAGVVKAVGLGVPLPLCSCGVVPAGIGLKNQGASNGSAVGFLISTPQTGIDSILVSASFLGWPFAIFKMVTAAVTGVVGGWLTDIVVQPSEEEQLNQQPIPTAKSTSTNDRFVHKLAEIWFHGLEIVQSIWIWLVIGILVSAAISTVLPESWLETVGSWGLLPAMFLVLLISLPLYVCATASVPIAAALVYGGIPAAAALVFLMAGPATNITTIGSIYSRFGWRTMVVYLSTIIVGSMVFAWFFDWLLTASVVKNVDHHHHHQTWWSIGSAMIMLAMMVYFAWDDVTRRLRHTPDSSNDEVPVMTIRVDGMTCGSCVGRLEKALRECKDIESAQVQLNPGQAVIKGEVKPDKIHEIVQELGFVSYPGQSFGDNSSHPTIETGV